METVIRNTFKTLPVEICSEIYEYYKPPFLNDIRTAKKPTGMWVKSYPFNLAEWRYVRDYRYRENEWFDVFYEKMNYGYP